MTATSTSQSSGTAGPAPSGQQVAGVFRTKVGDAEVTALLDGYIELTPDLWVNVSPDELEDSLRKDFLPPGPAAAHQRQRLPDQHRRSADRGRHRRHVVDHPFGA